MNLYQISLATIDEVEFHFPENIKMSFLNVCHTTHTFLICNGIGESHILSGLRVSLDGFVRQWWEKKKRCVRAKGESVLC